MAKNSYKLKLSDEDKGIINQLLKSGHLSYRVHSRCQALLWLDEGKSVQHVARLLGFNYNTITSWKKHYLQEGLERALYEETRSGRPCKYDGEQRAKITALACSDAPNGYNRWSLRLLADRIVSLDIADTISHTEVSKILKKTT